MVGPPPSRQQLLTDPKANQRWERDATADFDACQQLYDKTHDCSYNLEGKPRETLRDLQTRVKNDINNSLTRSTLRDLIIRPVLAIAR